MIPVKGKGGIVRWVKAPKSNCGTNSGYTRHIYKGERPCFECAEASRIYQRKRRGVTEIQPLKPHGTYAAWTRHYNEGSTPCDPCIEAQRAYQRESKARQRAAKKKSTTTETRAA